MGLRILDAGFIVFRGLLPFPPTKHIHHRDMIVKVPLSSYRARRIERRAWMNELKGCKDRGLLVSWGPPWRLSGFEASGLGLRVWRVRGSEVTALGRVVNGCKECKFYWAGGMGLGMWGQ